ncbi:MAG TPA: hypothetical protein VK859_06645, partial [bacterium]|nr:hypothetical protein [bacterium]
NFSGTNYTGLVTDNELLLLPTVHYYLGESVIRPYLLAGVGAEFESSTSFFVYGSVVNLDAAIGAGIEVPLARQISLFVEEKYNFVFADGIVGQDIPTFGGMRIGL